MCVCMCVCSVNVMPASASPAGRTLKAEADPAVPEAAPSDNAASTQGYYNYMDDDVPAAYGYEGNTALL